MGLRQERRIDIVSHPLENILSTATDEPAVKDNRERELSAQIIIVIKKRCTWNGKNVTNKSCNIRKLIFM